MRWNESCVIESSQMHVKLLEARYTRIDRFIIYVVLILIFIGCDTEKQWRLHEVTGHLPDMQFSLMSDTGQAVTEQTYQGYQVMMFFGFTNCLSECPTTMARLAKILQRLGKDANRTRILFVTLAPGRDTPEILHRYLAAFDPAHMIGLTGNEGDIEALTKRYRAAFRPGASDADDIAHSTIVYVFDSQGHARLLVTPDDAIETVVNDLRRLQALAPGT